jgi:prepilin-type N-terminal cleavage/methylation domain-containing protein
MQLFRQRSVNGQPYLMFNKRNYFCRNSGFTLVELIVVIAIIGVLIGGAAPSINGIIEYINRLKCNRNCQMVEQMYEMHLQLNEIEHSDMRFYQFLDKCNVEICPGNGDILYFDDEVTCNVHSTKTKADEPGDEVPFL